MNNINYDKVNIILAHNARLKSIVNQTKRKNRNINIVWNKIHKAIDSGEFKVWVDFGKADSFNLIIKTFEPLGYKCLPDNDQLLISWA